MYKEVTIDLVTDVCADCGITFGMPDHYMKKRREDGATFYCPNGHALHYKATKVDELKKQLEQANRTAEQYRNWCKAEQNDHQHTRNRLSATKGVLTKTKKRVANGVCPCCSRHFVNLERHMSTKHKDYAHNHEDTD